MKKLALSVACDDYDFLAPLRDGRVEPEGIDLRLLTVESGVRHGRMRAYGEYDACEYSMGSYMVARARGEDDLTAIPFFPRRMFGHRFCFVRANSGVRGPADLKGGRIGILGHQNSLALAVKGMLAHDYGLPLSSVTWVANRDERVQMKLAGGLKLERVDAGRSLEDLLLAGEIDALVQPDLPRAWLEGRGSLAMLFPDSEKAERDYYRRTRIFPIMHPIVIKSEILARDPWVATSLYEAFLRSQKLHRQFMEQPHRLHLVWNRQAEEANFFGKDPFTQGFEANRHDVKSLVDFADEQGLLPSGRDLRPEELFVRSALG